MLARRLTTKFSLNTTKRIGFRSLQFSNVVINNTDINKLPNKHTTIPNDFPSVNFNDAAVSFKSKTMYQLILARIIFTICQIKPIVNYSELMLNKSYKILGERFTNALLRSSFFSHFCGGESEKSIQPTVDYLQRNGVGSILDYAAEAEIPEKDKEIEKKKDLHQNEIIGRVYDYVDEDRCDMHLETFRQCILSVKAVSPTGFAAIKMTALGNPVLLERMSKMLIELKLLFQKFDPRNTGYVTRDDFIKIYRSHFKGGIVEEIYDSIDINRDGIFDYIEWTDSLKVEIIQELIDHCHDNEALVEASLDKNELKLVKRMRERISELAQLAKSLNVRLMIDAEHTYFQPAIDNITINLAETFNTDYPVIFSTYQMYLKDSRLRLFTDIDRAKRGKYKFAAKLVRGAYMVHERARAIEFGYEDPIHNSIRDTHNNYNRAVEEAIMQIGKGEQIEIMIASHNQQSVELAISSMKKHGLSPSSGVYFGQLLGMSDHLSFGLGNYGFKVYKYVPYGPVREVMPYLIRRAQENSDALGGAKNEVVMIDQELKSRLFNTN